MVYILGMIVKILMLCMKQRLIAWLAFKLINHIEVFLLC